MAPGATLTADAATLLDPATAPRLESPAAPAGAAINRPTIPMAQYRAIKQAAGHAPQTSKPSEPAGPRAAIAVTASGNGQSRGAPGLAYFPPDGGGSTGLTQTVQALNSKLGVYSKANPPALQCVNSFATLTGYTAQGLFDPRAVYDTQWNRWVVTVEAFPESQTVQRQFILISTTSNACGSWIKYNIDVNFVNAANNNFFWDFPGTGMTQDAVIMTANIFNPGFAGSASFAVAKALLYNGLGFSVPIFASLGGTIAPPYVLDQNPNAYMLQILGSTALGRRTFVNPANAFFASLTGATSIPTAAIAIPRNAIQPGCPAAGTCALDTSDARFSSSSTQYGTHLWNTHTINLSGFPAPKFYDVRTDAAALAQSGFYFHSGSSDDYNASLAARPNGTVYLGWNDSNASTRVEQLVTGRKASDPNGTTGTKVVTFTSPTVLTGNFDSNFGCQRWGDYAATSLDPSSATAGWAMNETVATSSLWGTRFSRFNVS